MKRSLLILFVFNLLSTMVMAQSVLDRTVSVTFEEVPLEMALESLSRSADIHFAYSSGLLPDTVISLKAEETTVHGLLNSLFRDTDIKFLVYAGQVILQKAPPGPKKIMLHGVILDAESQEPAPYSTVEIKSLNNGAVADDQGRFSLEIKREHIGDTLIFSSMGYKRLQLIARALSGNGFHRIYLNRKTYELDPVEIDPKKYRTRRLGNHSSWVRGSMYIDTHGQQTALFIENDKNVQGEIIAVQFFLSKKGNTGAPFRVRIYKPDSITGRPGKDLLPHMLVVKPEHNNGWFTVDISEFSIPVPHNGFFIAIEGVFPNNYESYVQNSGFVELSEIERGFDDASEDPDFISESVSYGQRLAYCRKRQNNTWHYSLSHTWFQVDKRHYSAMISAVIEFEQE